jgi:hypothetical protein
MKSHEFRIITLDPDSMAPTGKSFFTALRPFPERAVDGGHQQQVPERALQAGVVRHAAQVSIPRIPVSAEKLSDKF